MDYTEIIRIVVSLVEGLAICIPLVIALVKNIKKAVQEKNWNHLIRMAFDYMAEAEELFSEGAAKKAWVMRALEETAIQTGMEWNAEVEQKISQMIDDTCALAKELVKK